MHRTAISRKRAPPIKLGIVHHQFDIIQFGPLILGLKLEVVESTGAIVSLNSGKIESMNVDSSKIPPVKLEVVGSTGVIVSLNSGRIESVNVDSSKIWFQRRICSSESVAETVMSV